LPVNVIGLWSPTSSACYTPDTMYLHKRAGTTWEPNPEYLPPKPGEPEVHRAAREGDADALGRLAAAGADLNGVFDMSLDPHAYPRLATPLMVAAGSGDGATVETVRVLLRLGADPALETTAGSAAVFACVGLGWNYRPGGDAARLRILLDAGCPLPLSGERASRLVAQVAALADPARLSLLLGLGVPATAVFDPELALERHRRSRASMRAYEESQPDPFADLPEALRASLRETGARQERADEERAISAPSSLHIPLFQAVGSGSEECVRLLLAAGADVHQRDDCRRSALWEAWTEALAKLLVREGLNIEERDWLDWTPLVSAVDDLAKTRALVAAGANVNATQDQGYTVFMSAAGCSERSLEVLRFLVASGADPHAVSALGYNAFHAAIDVNGEANREESVRDTLGYLKSLGIDLELRNRRGHTPLGRALVEGTATEVKVLCEIGADVNAWGPPGPCGAAGSESVLEPLLFLAVTAAVDPDQKGDALLHAGADPLAEDGRGRTALDAALEHLCAGVGESRSRVRSFYAGLGAVRAPAAGRDGDRERFLSRLRPVLEQYARAFSDQIPVAPHAYAARRREHMIRVLATLAGQLWWARGARPAGAGPERAGSGPGDRGGS
jgi:ankyrin repeat protein